MNREELKEYMPHREPMLLVDEIEIDDEGVAHAKYRIRENHPDATKKDHIKEIQQSSGFLAIKVKANL